MVCVVTCSNGKDGPGCIRPVSTRSGNVPVLTRSLLNTRSRRGHSPAPVPERGSMPPRELSTPRCARPQTWARTAADTGDNQGKCLGRTWGSFATGYATDRRLSRLLDSPCPQPARLAGLAASLVQYGRTRSHPAPSTPGVPAELPRCHRREGWHQDDRPGQDRARAKLGAPIRPAASRADQRGCQLAFHPVTDR
jgi:hypothetical protein